jgi:hypothetical protein
MSVKSEEAASVKRRSGAVPGAAGACQTASGRCHAYDHAYARARARARTHARSARKQSEVTIYAVRVHARADSVLVGWVSGRVGVGMVAGCEHLRRRGQWRGQKSAGGTSR